MRVALNCSFPELRQQTAVLTLPKLFTRVHTTVVTNTAATNMVTTLSAESNKSTRLTMTPAIFDLRLLPQELQDMVTEFAVIEHDTITCDLRRSVDEDDPYSPFPVRPRVHFDLSPREPAFALVDRRARREALPFFWQLNTFHFRFTEGLLNTFKRSMLARIRAAPVLTRKDRVSDITDSYIGYSPATALAKTEVACIELHHKYKDMTTATVGVCKRKDGSFVSEVLLSEVQDHTLDKLQETIMEFSQHSNSLLALCVHLESRRIEQEAKARQRRR